MSNENQALVEKWSPLLDHPDLPAIKDKTRRDVTATLLETQMKEDAKLLRHSPEQSLTRLLTEAPTNSMGASSSVASTGNIDIFDPVMISLVRRTMPNLMAYDICGVQPMTGPTGLIFALRSRYSAQDGIEALFAEANTTFGSSAAGNTASITAAGTQIGLDPSTLVANNASYTVAKAMTTAAAEGLGTPGNQFNEMAMSIEKVSVTARSVALKAEYSHELAQDLKAVHGLDAESELANILSAEILAEINRQIIRSIYTTATIGAQSNVTTLGTFDCDADSSGRWSVEKWKGLLFQIERESNAIARATRMGKGNIVITSSDVASAFNMAGLLDYQSAMQGERLQVDDTGNTFAGTLFGRTKVYIDPYFQSSAGSQYAVVGYKGSSQWDAGLFYSPYVPLQMHRAVGPDSFQPKLGFKTRFGLVAHPFATAAADGDVAAAKKNSYYRLFRIQNLL